MSYICIVEHRRHADKSTEQGEEAGEGNMLEKSRRNGWNEKNIKEEQQEEEAQGNVKSNNKHEEEECESGPVRTICARALMAPSSGSPVRALIWAPAFEPPTELACGAVHGMLLPVPNRQRWPPWGHPHPMPAVQPPAQHIVFIYILIILFCINRCT